MKSHDGIFRPQNSIMICDVLIIILGVGFFLKDMALLLTMGDTRKPPQENLQRVSHESLQILVWIERLTYLSLPIDIEDLPDDHSLGVIDSWGVHGETIQRDTTIWVSFHEEGTDLCTRLWGRCRDRGTKRGGYRDSYLQLLVEILPFRKGRDSLRQDLSHRNFYNFVRCKAFGYAIKDSIVPADKTRELRYIWDSLDAVSHLFWESPISQGRYRRKSYFYKIRYHS